MPKTPDETAEETAAAICNIHVLDEIAREVATAICNVRVLGEAVSSRSGTDIIKKALAQLAEQEREACANLCDDMANKIKDILDRHRDTLLRNDRRILESRAYGLQEASVRIRRRGETP